LTFDFFFTGVVRLEKSSGRKCRKTCDSLCKCVCV
jgi:hypothetical protein